MIGTIDEIPVMLYGLIDPGEAHSHFCQRAGISIGTATKILRQRQLPTSATLMQICNAVDAKCIFYILPIGAPFSRRNLTRKSAEYLELEIKKRGIKRGEFDDMTAPSGETVSSHTVWRWFGTTKRPDLRKIKAAFEMLGYTVWVEIKRKGT